MVEDRPWSSRIEMGAWYNSEWFIEGIPLVLEIGKENVLIIQHNLPRSFISTYGRKCNQKTWCNQLLPHEYNTLRLDYIDKIDVKNPKIVHHTGEKGNNVIRELINA